MARSDWAALLTEPAAEYIARTELERFGLQPYLPQLRKRHHTRPGKFVMRRYPLFPRYLLIPLAHAHDPAIRLARGIAKHRPILADDDGRPWRAPSKVIEAVKLAETRGEFDEILHKGDAVTFSYGVLATIRAVLVTDPSERASCRVAELLTPLFGGVRARIDPARVSHA